jgi:hypothetical protein
VRAALVEGRVVAVEFAVPVPEVVGCIAGFRALGVFAVVADLAADTTGFTADRTDFGAATFGRPLVAAFTVEAGALALGAGTGLGVMVGADGAAAATLGVAAWAAGVLTVAVGAVTPTEGTAGAVTEGDATGGTVAFTAPDVWGAGVFTAIPTAGVVTDTTGTATLGTETLTPGRPVPCATAEPAHAPSASRQTKTAGPRIPRMRIHAWCHRLGSRNGYQTTLSRFLKEGSHKILTRRPRDLRARIGKRVQGAFCQE